MVVEIELLQETYIDNKNKEFLGKFNYHQLVKDIEIDQKGG